jgi:hypothetical protein
MGKTQGRAPNGQHDNDEGARSTTPDLQVERLRQRFMRFRSEHKPRTRYPQALRAAVLVALRSGVAEPELRRACGLSAEQLAAWRRREAVEARQSAMVRHPAQIFSVVDESHPDVSDKHAVHPGGQDVELCVGGWAVRLRRLEG